MLLSICDFTANWAEKAAALLRASMKLHLVVWYLESKKHLRHTCALRHRVGLRLLHYCRVERFSSCRTESTVCFR